LSGRPEYPLASGWWSAERGDESRIVATTDWFVACLANYLERRPLPSWWRTFRPEPMPSRPPDA
jgi:hypothetical protein